MPTVSLQLGFSFWTWHSEWSLVLQWMKGKHCSWERVSHTSEKAGDRVGSCHARSCSSRLVLCTFSMARQRCLSHVRNVERFTAQCTFCTSRVLIFLKPPLILLIIKPYIVKSAFSWHCVSLLHNTSCNNIYKLLLPNAENIT